MTRDRNDSLIVQSVISPGHNLGLSLVAEGVETDSTLAVLSGLACDIAQGNQIGEPMPATAFDAWRPSTRGCVRHPEAIGTRAATPLRRPTMTGERRSPTR